MVAVWRSGNGVTRINEVTMRLARLVLEVLNGGQMLEAEVKARRNRKK